MVCSTPCFDIHVKSYMWHIWYAAYVWPLHTILQARYSSVLTHNCPYSWRKQLVERRNATRNQLNFVSIIQKHLENSKSYLDTAKNLDIYGNWKYTNYMYKFNGDPICIFDWLKPVFEPPDSLAWSSEWLLCLQRCVAQELPLSCMHLAFILQYYNHAGRNLGQVIACSYKYPSTQVLRIVQSCNLAESPCTERRVISRSIWRPETWKSRLQHSLWYLGDWWVKKTHLGSLSLPTKGHNISKMTYSTTFMPVGGVTAMVDIHKPRFRTDFTLPMLAVQ